MLSIKQINKFYNISIKEVTLIKRIKIQDNTIQFNKNRQINQFKSQKLHFKQANSSKFKITKSIPHKSLRHVSCI